MMTTFFSNMEFAKPFFSLAATGLTAPLVSLSGPPVAHPDRAPGDSCSAHFHPRRSAIDQGANAQSRTDFRLRFFGQYHSRDAPLDDGDNESDFRTKPK
jgi:hypothetical protein